MAAPDAAAQAQLAQVPALGGAQVPAVWNRTTAWPTPVVVGEHPAANGAPTSNNVTISGFSDLPVYDLRNGDIENIAPWAIHATIAEGYKWCPVAGLSAANSIQGAYGYMKTYAVRFAQNNPEAWTADQIHIAAVAMGTARAVIQATFNLGVADFNPKETTPPILEAIVPAADAANQAITYRSLMRPPVVAAGAAAAAGGAEWVDPMATAFELTEDDKALIPIFAMSAQGIIAIQGHNIMAEGHHYLSGRNTAGFRAFSAVEKQLWHSSILTVKEALATHDALLKNVMWHKAGHPVAMAIKLHSATSRAMADRLIKLGMGASGCRLPAVETEVRALDTYARVAANVATCWAGTGAAFNAEVFTLVRNALNMFPYGEPKDPHELAAGVIVRNRSDCLRLARAVIQSSESIMATLYGFYAKMVDDADEGNADPKTRTLLLARSLVKLKNENLANYQRGANYYKAWDAAQKKNRAEGVFAPMPVEIFLPGQF